MARLAFTLAAILFGTVVSAEVPLPPTFHCNILQAFKVSDEGLLIPSEDFWQNTYSKDQLVVDREAGSVIHPFFGTTNYQETLYLDSGSDQWSFKLLAYTMALEPDSPEGRNAVATLVQVFTYREGTKKPFIAIEDSNLVTGLCE